MARHGCSRRDISEALAATPLFQRAQSVLTEAYRALLEAHAMALRMIASALACH